MDQTLEARKLDLQIAVLEQELAAKERENRYYTGTDTAKGIFSLFCAISEEPVKALVHQISTWTRLHPGGEVKLLINSPGGVVVDGFALYDFLQEVQRSGHKVITKGYGMQASMGGILMQVGDERVLSPRSWMLIHEVQGIAAGSFSKMEDDMKFNEKLQNQALDILSAKASLTKQTIKKRWKRQDWWLSADEAVSHGLADRIEG